MRSPVTLLAGLAVILAVISPLVFVPLWIPVALLGVAFLVREGVIRM